jgi:hypothetical protein
MLCLDPTGSTNFGKLTNITLSHHFADGVQDGNFQLVCSAVNNNVVRISGGALGFPVL